MSVVACYSIIRPCPIKHRVLFPILQVNKKSSVSLPPPVTYYSVPVWNDKMPSSFATNPIDQLIKCYDRQFQNFRIHIALRKLLVANNSYDGIGYCYPFSYTYSGIKWYRILHPQNILCNIHIYVSNISTVVHISEGNFRHIITRFNFSISYPATYLALYLYLITWHVHISDSH